MEALKMEDRVDRWNDDRLDDLSRRMDEGFKEMREGFKRVDEHFERIDERFERVDERFERVDERFERVNERFDRLLHTLALISWGVAGTFLAALVSVLVAVLT